MPFRTAAALVLLALPAAAQETAAPAAPAEGEAPAYRFETWARR